MSSGCPRAALYQDEPHPDPYAVYARMRADHGPVVPVELEPGVHGWLVTDYATLISWSRDTTTFSHDARLWRDFTEGRVNPDSPLLPMMAPRANALFVEGTEHQRYRRAITDGIGAIDTEHLGRITSRYAERLIDEFCERGRADALNEYARMLPLLVMNDLFGFDEDQGLRFVAAMRNLWQGVDAERSNAEAERALSEVVSAKHREPGDDLTTRLIQHRAALSDEEVIMQLLLVIAAANEPTANLIAASLRAALDDPALTGYGSASLSDTALGDLLDRVLWQDPPITNYPAVYPRVDVPLGDGRVIGAGTPVLLGFAASNHFFLRENAEQMEESTNRAHVAWGAGPHRCPARDEATTIAIIAVRVLLARLPGLRMAVPPEQLRWRLSTLSWTPVQLPVEFAPQVPPPSDPEEGTSWSPSASHPETSEPKQPTSVSSGLSSLSNFLVRLLRGS
ncbi:cytochrome P450 [Nocardiopsis arvandica]|uniref:Cytochrome P450 n=2 Tax=Nocardiopsis sinuspersici TaxID=501010 RepID=A0A7Y9XC74_9ACTN|nr:cytochrome P450 [Nocardiopsis sinuspersici]